MTGTSAGPVWPPAVTISSPPRNRTRPGCRPADVVQSSGPADQDGGVAIDTTRVVNWGSPDVAVIHDLAELPTGRLERTEACVPQLSLIFNLCAASAVVAVDPG